MWQVSRVSLDRWEGLVGYGGREVKAGSGRVCFQGLSPSNLTKRGGRGGEFPASEGSRHLFLIFLSIYDFLPLPPSDSWGWLQPESPCRGKVLGKSPRRLQGFGAHFSLKKPNPGRVARTGKESWPGMSLCPVASLHSEWGVRGRGWCSCACMHPGTAQTLACHFRQAKPLIG